MIEERQDVQSIDESSGDSELGAPVLTSSMDSEESVESLTSPEMMLQQHVAFCKEMLDAHAEQLKEELRAHVTTSPLPSTVRQSPPFKLLESPSNVVDKSTGLIF